MESIVVHWSGSGGDLQSPIAAHHGISGQSPRSGRMEMDDFIFGGPSAQDAHRPIACVHVFKHWDRAGSFDSALLRIKASEADAQLCHHYPWSFFFWGGFVGLKHIVTI